MRLTLTLLIWLYALPLQAACRQALAMALDVSSSVDRTEYQLQLNGLAGALLDPEVQALLLFQPNAPIDLAVFEWSGPTSQRLILPWTTISDAADLRAVVGVLQNQRRPGGTETTAIGAALEYGAALLQQRQSCWALTIDISGDGKRNAGPRPRSVLARTGFDDITVNALVIGTDAPSGDQITGNEIAELSSYFRAEVLHGENAFLETALGFQDFQRAMKQKLLRELNVAIAQFGGAR